MRILLPLIAAAMLALPAYATDDNRHLDAHPPDHGAALREGERHT